MLPAYMNELWQAYWRMSREDRGAVDTALIDADPSRCSEELLPYLAWECGVDISGLDVDTARAVVVGAIDSSRMAGTIGSLDAALAAFGEIEVKEWFETGKAPYIFDLDLSLADREITVNLLSKVEAIAREKKNVRSLLGELTLSYRVGGEAFSFTGALGESGGFAQMIDGYTNGSLGAVYSAAGSLGEVESTVIMVEV